MLTPLATFSSEQETWEYFNSLFETNGGCELPCWWDITPGVTTWVETKRFLERFSRHPDYPVFTKALGQDENVPGYSNRHDSYIWWAYAPGIDYAPSVVFDVSGDLVGIINVPDEIVHETFPLHYVLQRYGVPDLVFVGPNPYVPYDAAYLETIVYVIYDKLHIMMMIHLAGKRDNGPLKVCESWWTESLLLWAPTEEQTMSFFEKPEIRPLEQVSSMTPQSFHDKYQYKMPFTEICIDINNDVWMIDP